MKCVLMCDRGLSYDRLSVMPKASLERLSMNKGAVWGMGDVARSDRTMALTEKYQDYHLTAVG